MTESLPAAIPATTSAKRDGSPGTTRRGEVIDARSGGDRVSRASFPTAEWRTLEALCDRVMPQPKDRPPVPLAAYVDQKMARGQDRGLSLRPDAAAGRGLAARRWPRWTRRRSARYGRAFALLTGRPSGRAAAPDADGIFEAEALGRHAVARPSSTIASFPTSPTPITPIPPPGTRSAWAARPARAAMCGWAWTGATRGRPSRPPRRGRQRRRGRTRVSADPFAAPRAANGRAPDVFKPGGWVPMRQFGEDEAVDFVVVGTGAGGGPLIAGLAEQGFSVDRLRRRALFPAAGGFRLRRARAGEALLDRRPHRGRRQPDHHGRQEQRQGRRRQHRPFRDGVAALPAGMVQVAQRARLRRRLAARLAGDVGLLSPRPRRRSASPGP